MQNLPVSGAPSAAPQTSAQPDGVVDRPAEPFGSVLARCQESADGGAIAPSPTGGTSAANGSGDNHSGNVPDVTGDRLATPLPVADSINAGAATVEGASLPERAADRGGILADAVLAALQTAAPPAQTGALPFKPEASIGSGGTRYTAPPHFRAQDYSGAAFAGSRPGAIRSEVFPAAPGMPGSDAAPPWLLHADSSERFTSPTTLPDAAAATAPPQTGASPNAGGPIGAAQNRMGTPLANPAWGEEFGQRIIWMVTQREHTAELHLNPPDLGPLDVVLSVSGDQATALFTSPHAAVRSAVEQALPKLREMLADNGIMLGNATVGDQPPGERHAGTGGQQKVWHGAEAVPAGGTQSGLAAWHGRRQEGMVDTFV
ncbi:MAG: flagellar hook-length control protein FliK [Nitrosomonadales bacterium]|nr:flagellar hook-length control protein FliK [Nitrosomonadales bacterium]